MKQIMHGDAFGIPIWITDSDDNPVTPTECIDVEVALGHLIKSYVKGGVTFEAADGCWVLNLTQEDTFSLGKNEPMRIRIKMSSRTTIGTEVDIFNVIDSESKAIL